MSDDQLFPFQHSAHDRLEARRRDPRWWQAVRSDERTRVLVSDGTALAADADGLVLVPPSQAPDGEWLLLGEADGTTYVGVMTDESDDDRHVALRHLALRLDPVQASLAVHATGLVQWHRRHPRCAVCGATTRVEACGAHRVCPACGTQHFPRTDPAVIMLITDGDDRALLASHTKHGHRTESWYTTLAGFVEPGESLEDAVRREVAEETSVQVGEVEYFASQPWPFPSSLMLGFRGRAVTTGIEADPTEIQHARWFTREEFREGCESGELGVPGPISVSHALIRDWYGAALPRPRS